MIERMRLMQESLDIIEREKKRRNPNTDDAFKLQGGFLPVAEDKNTVINLQTRDIYSDPRNLILILFVIVYNSSFIPTF